MKNIGVSKTTVKFTTSNDSIGEDCSGYICVMCGKVVQFPDVRGSACHPYCKSCYGKEGEDGD